MSMKEPSALKAVLPLVVLSWPAGRQSAAGERIGFVVGEGRRVFLTGVEVWKEPLEHGVEGLSRDTAGDGGGRRDCLMDGVRTALS